MLACTFKHLFNFHISLRVQAKREQVSKKGTSYLFKLVEALNHVLHLLIRHTWTDGEGEFGVGKELGDGEGELREVPGLTRIAFLFMRSNRIMDDSADTLLCQIIMQRVTLTILHDNWEEVIYVMRIIESQRQLN